MLRVNEGYTILKAERYSKDYEIVIAVNKVMTYVTWECKGQTDYFWGHYFTDYATALRDYHTRLAKQYDLQIKEPG